MKNSSAVLGIALGLLLATAGWAKPGDRSAIVLKSSGHASTTKGTLRSGMVLSSGDSVQLGPGAECVVLVLATSRREKVRGPLTLRVLDRGLEGAHEVAQARLSIAPSGRNYRVLAGAVMRGGSVLTPRIAAPANQPSAPPRRSDATPAPQMPETENSPALAEAGPASEAQVADLQLRSDGLLSWTFSGAGPAHEPCSVALYPGFSPPIVTQANEFRAVKPAVRALAKVDGVLAAENGSYHCSLSGLPTDQKLTLVLRVGNRPSCVLRVQRLRSSEERSLADALCELDKRILVRPDSMENFVEKATLQEDYDQLGGATKTLLAALRKHPSDAGLKEQLARVCADGGRLGLANQYLQSWLEDSKR